MKVIGSSMAMVATGPRPGSTPTSVPSSDSDQAEQQVLGGEGDAEAESEVLEEVGHLNQIT